VEEWSLYQVRFYEWRLGEGGSREGMKPFFPRERHKKKLVWIAAGGQSQFHLRTNRGPKPPFEEGGAGFKAREEIVQEAEQTRNKRDGVFLCENERRISGQVTTFGNGQGKVRKQMIA